MRNTIILLLASVSVLSCGGPAANTSTAGANAPITPSATATQELPAATPRSPQDIPTASASPSPVANSNYTTQRSSGTTANSNLGGKVTKPGATPTPGIPSPEEMRRLMSGKPKGDPNQPPPAMQGPPMMKSNRPTGGRMTGNSNTPQ